ncbi:Olfactory receptor 14C36 [Sciurus carolinensis]|uniref:Olfactory receptor 14C36 n=1 Tax=Sciurus carolinensis TaxID=30640 RepID=A0AA41N7L4_SCICA|nr:Olfactory receptor 14C36 [Sciurus carolinensis]
MYLSTLLGILLIIAVTSADQKLHTPTYFFLRNLSNFDICFISITVPNDCVKSITVNRAISVAGCTTQIFLVIFCTCVELLFLSIMTWVHYVICQLLQYPIIMNPQFCVCMTLAILLSGLVYVCRCAHWEHLLAVLLQVKHDPSLLRLSCSDMTSKKVLILVSTVVV